jgi:hypothetical protein
MQGRAYGVSAGAVAVAKFEFSGKERTYREAPGLDFFQQVARDIGEVWPDFL